ncbi:nitronate monooxygenase, partial [Mycobacterium sp. UM_CSW]|uniref:nitronate monooxygenase n=1 Tax=Mycobacterium sp. UM_CSW TaxID=1370119 RepID=UPI00187262CB
GVADGRGLAAALALGADGALVGTRFWASTEAAVSARAQQRVIGASGDDTVRTRVYDLVRQLDWPAEYTVRALGNPFLDTWHGHEEQLSASLAEAVEAFQTATAAEDFDTAAIIIGEAVGLLRQIRPAADIVHDMVAEAGKIRCGTQYRGDQLDVRSSRLCH